MYSKIKVYRFAIVFLNIWILILNKFICGTKRDSFNGIGKPEALKYALSGFWSRRITDEHRMIYRVDGDDLLITQLRHYY